MFRRFPGKMSFLILAIGWVLLDIDAFGAAQPSPGAQPGSAQTKVGDDELHAFVRAYVETQKIRQQYEPPLQKSTDPNKSQNIQNEANTELKATLAKHNLTVAQYNRIFSEVNSDAQLREKTLGLVKQERQRSSGRSR